MQKLLSKHGLAAHLAFLAVAPLFLFPWCTPAAIATVELWLALFAAVWTLMEPSRRSDELLHDARERVAAAIVRDPLFWVLSTLVAYAAIRWANGGIALKCDFNGGSPFWYLREAGWNYLPGSVDGAGYPPFAGALAALVLAQGCGHALGKAARASFLFAASSLSGLAAVAAIVACELGCPGALKAAWCANMTASSFVGTAFGLQLVAGIAALAGIFEFRWGRQVPLLMLAVGGNAAGLFFFAPPAVVLVFAVAAVLALVVALAYVAFGHGIATMARCIAVFFISMLIPVLLGLVVAAIGEKSLSEAAALVRKSKTSANAEAPEIDDGDMARAAMYLVCSNRLAFASGNPVFPGSFAVRRDVLSAMSERIWSERPWLGAGLGAYPLAMRFNAAADDWRVLGQGADERPMVDELKVAVGDTDEAGRCGNLVSMPGEWAGIGAGRAESPLNGWWMLLSERGLTGAVAIAVAVGFLLFNVVRRLIGAWGRNVFVPSCVTGPVVLVALVAEAFVDASFLRPEVLAVAAAFLALSASSFPPARRQVDVAGGANLQANK